MVSQDKSFYQIYYAVYFIEWNSSEYVTHSSSRKCSSCDRNMLIWTPSLIPMHQMMITFIYSAAKDLSTISKAYEGSWWDKLSYIILLWQAKVFILESRRGDPMYKQTRAVILWNSVMIRGKPFNCHERVTRLLDYKSSMHMHGQPNRTHPSTEFSQIIQGTKSKKQKEK